MKTKRNNVAKKLGIASLCLATLVSAFSGFASFKTAGKVIAEEGIEVDLEDFVETNAAVSRETFESVSPGNKDKTVTENALTLRSSEPYTATFKTIFNGDTTFNYRFAETKTTTGATQLCGDFKFRVTDVTNEDNYFELIHYVRRRSSTTKYNFTGFYLKYGTEIRTSATASVGSGATTANSIVTNTNLSTPTNDFLPHFLCYGERTTRLGKLFLDWDSNGVLTISAYTADSSATITSTAENAKVIIAKFDGTDTFTASAAQSKSCGLPILKFPEGYTITVSSSFENGTTADQASDVMFTSIVNGSTTYNFDANDTITKDAHMEAYDKWFGEPEIPVVEPGKVLLGYKDEATGALYAESVEGYSPVYLGFERIPGASVRIDTSAEATSGLRFITGFNVAEYDLVKDYITEFGTLLAFTDALTPDLDFTIENYADNAKVLKVPNTKGVYEYTHQDVTYSAYSVAITNLPETYYTQSYSARGYIVVEYADGTTATIYTAFDEANNSRSIAQTAYNIKTLGAAEYETYGPKQKAIVDMFASAYVVPETPVEV